MRHADLLLFALLLFTGLSISPDAVQAQARQESRPERKVVERTTPVYPELAKRAQIKGIVKMEVAVRPNGSVKSVRVLGGNAALIGSATDAVQKWKFEPAPQETVEVVQITFEPH